jgi:hypothetical protein
MNSDLHEHPEPSGNLPPGRPLFGDSAAAGSKKPLDMVVKLGLGVFVGSFVLIWGGMFLTRPDRSIPPYSVGSQEGRAVAIHVPSWTSDAQIETLIERFQHVGRETRNFGPMKIRPTTPGDPTGQYRRISIYIFTHDAWAEPDMLHRYLEKAQSSLPEDRALRTAFENAVRGFYRLDDSIEEGRIGPLSQQQYGRLLFRGPVGSQTAGPASLPSE